MTAPATAPVYRGETLASVTANLNAWIEIDLGALDRNVAALRNAVGPRVELIAVVKADAYGAGVEGIAPALERAGVDRFAVAWLAEALALRELGVSRPIVVLGHSFPANTEAAIAADVMLTVDTPALAEAISAAATAAGRTARVNLHVDSGLHREGVTVDDAVALANVIRSLPGIELEGLSTHMANADEPDDSYSDTQHSTYDAAASALPWVPYRHVANSATSLRRPEYRYQGVRVGLALHGILPENTPATAVEPILSLKARLARVSGIGPGEGVSYGLTWRAGADTIAGLVPVGYADGWRRALGNRGHVLVGGKPCPIIGRVCMDMFVADVTGVPGAAAGDEAVLIGTQGGARITAETVATEADTIPWDIFSGLGRRLPRLFHRGGIVERCL